MSSTCTQHPIIRSYSLELTINLQCRYTCIMQHIHTLEPSEDPEVFVSWDFWGLHLSLYVNILQFQSSTSCGETLLLLLWSTKKEVSVSLHDNFIPGIVMRRFWNNKPSCQDIKFTENICKTIGYTRYSQFLYSIFKMPHCFYIFFAMPYQYNGSSLNDLFAHIYIRHSATVCSDGTAIDM